MMRVAVTGHMDVRNDAVEAIRAAIDAELERLSDRTGSITGVSCIARGADSIFADAVLEHGFTLEVILPSQDYRHAKVKPHERDRFDAFAKAAAAVRVMPFSHAGREAYEAANSALLQGADVLLAIWDGDTSKQGGTGTVVEEARTVGVPVTVIWPRGAGRNGS